MEYIEYFKGFTDVVKGLPNLEIIKDFVFWIIISILIISCLLQKYSKKHKVFTKIASAIAEEFNNKIKEEMREESKDFHKAIKNIDDKIEKSNKENAENIQSVRADVDILRKAIDDHLLESRTAHAKQWREWIFDFQAKEKNGIVQPLERWENILKTITDYQQYIRDYNIDNGYIDSAVIYIRARYAKHCELNDFPLEEHTDK